MTPSTHQRTSSKKGNEELARRFGAAGEQHHNLALGRDERAVVPEWEANSYSHEETFARDRDDEACLAAILLDQASRVARRLRRSGVGGVWSPSNRDTQISPHSHDVERSPRLSTSPHRSTRKHTFCFMKCGTVGRSGSLESVSHRSRHRMRSYSSSPSRRRIVEIGLLLQQSIDFGTATGPGRLCAPLCWGFANGMVRNPLSQIRNS